MELPKEYVNVMITYKGQITVRDKYFDHKESAIVTRRAFYSKSDGYYDNKDNWIKTPNGKFNVPQYWSMWQGALLPQSFHHYPRVLPEDIISWEYCKES